MLKQFCLKIFAPLILVLILLQIPWSWQSALAENSPRSLSQSRNAEAVEIVSPQIKIKSNGERVAPKQQNQNQNTPRQLSQTRGRHTYPNPPHPYNREAIEKFDQELYGN